MEKFFKFLLYAICVIVGFCMLDCMCSSCLGCDSCVAEFCYEACGMDCSGGCADGCDGCDDGCSGGCEAGCESCLDSCEPPPESYEYSYDENGHQFGYMPSWNTCVYEGYSGSATDITIPEKFGDRPVIEITSYAFSGNNNINKVTLPSTVTVIENYAFQNCRNLREIVMPAVTTISSYAFSGCTTLQTINLPATLTTIGDYAFYDCSYLRNAQYEGTLAQWCNNINFTSSNFFNSIDALYIDGEIVYDLKITSDVTRIAPYAFSGYALHSVEVEEGAVITEIGEYAFADCNLLSDLKINGAVDTIKARAFMSCPALTNITLNKNVKKFEEYVFYDTTNINTVTYNGYIADWCATEFNLNSSTEDASSNPLSQARYFKTSNGYEGDLDIPHSVEIKPFAFAEASMITSVRTRRNVIIGNYAFYGCNNLNTVITEDVGDGVTRINPRAFKGCSSLVSLTIGANVRSIEAHAFANCTSLTNVYIPNTVLTMGSQVFYGCSSLVINCQAIHLPSGWNYDWDGDTTFYWGASKP